MATDTMTRGLVEAKLDGIDVSSITNIVLADGPHRIENCELVQFAVGEAHSPISAPKFYPALRYSEEGLTWRTPLAKVLSFADGGSRGQTR